MGDVSIPVDVGILLEKAAFSRDQAARCRRLSKLVGDADLHLKLIELALVSDGVATELERAAGAPCNEAGDQGVGSEDICG